jgi:3-oxoacyl-[acyl-carrier-protein] synthase II
MLFPKPLILADHPRVVITGAGLVTALGIGWQTNALGFRLGRTAFGPVTLFDVSRQRVKIAAEVKLPELIPPGAINSCSGTRESAAEMRLSHESRYIRICTSSRHAARLDRATRMLLLATHEAWAQAGWTAARELPLVLGTTAGGMSLGEAYYRQAVQTPRRHRQQPTRALHYQAQTQASLVSKAFGLGGPITLVANACASGANAVGFAFEWLRRGRAERVLAGGCDALCQLVFAGFDSLQALSPRPCRPFDAHRDGLSIGEGAAVVALETLESARRRGAAILGEIAGYATVIDMHHLTQPHPDGDAALSAMSQACAMAQVTPGQIDYLNAHGTGTPLNDSAEALAIARWAGASAAKLPVSSTKASIGHTLGAAGAVEVVVCLMALRGQWLPPETTLETPDPICPFPLVRQPMDAPLEFALSNSFGFGGVNASLVLRRWA